jgi:hypothetical protein
MISNIKNLVEYKLRSINEYLAPSRQRLELKKQTYSNVTCMALCWYRPLDENYEQGEIIYEFDVDNYDDIYLALLGIEYGMRIEKNI